jgi:hypothetical protein
VCATKINNKTVSEERGETRKDARDNSALRAMQTMSPEPPPPAQALEIVKLAMNQYTHLTQHIKVFFFDSPFTSILLFVKKSFNLKPSNYMFHVKHSPVFENRLFVGLSVCFVCIYTHIHFAVTSSL